LVFTAAWENMRPACAPSFVKAWDVRPETRAVEERGHRPDVEIAAADSRVRVLLIHAREEIVIARETRRAASLALKSPL